MEVAWCTWHGEKFVTYSVYRGRAKRVGGAIFPLTRGKIFRTITINAEP
ncbi:MAG: hypothetical protein BLITH_0505 [Brockia lithotrophica]|uniref:Uncharacterized protein n=1 Tax=Brockia lithotrophica TaxID=933949 RepID=A0A2T5G4J3_9BACL|nr:hypothetical protein [Brockia lithotrophica]MBT9253337.1 hypothetical protein [Brockia lithotrophica]PTQ51075.1 MAG: hypothetical protein BLITH_0505 [Brockia lithotrophica]